MTLPCGGEISARIAVTARKLSQPGLKLTTSLPRGNSLPRSPPPALTQIGETWTLDPWKENPLEMQPRLLSDLTHVEAARGWLPRDNDLEANEEFESLWVDPADD